MQRIFTVRKNNHAERLLSNILLFFFVITSTPKNKAWNAAINEITWNIHNILGLQRYEFYSFFLEEIE